MNRITATLGFFFILATASLCGALVALEGQHDLFAIALAALGALSLRALSLSARIAERGAG